MTRLRSSCRVHGFARLLVVGLFLGADTTHGLDWTEQSGVRRAPLPSPGPGGPGFVSLPPNATGITFTNRLDEERSLTNQIFLDGSGVALGDVDGDGRPDLYLCGLDSPNALYRNLGRWRFEDVTSAAGVACADQASTGAVFADLDGDRDVDLLVNGVARGTRLFLNDGHGRFTEATDSWGLRSTSGATSSTLADVDGDGWLDLYVANYRNDTLRDRPEMAFTVGTTNGVRRLLTVDGQPATAPEWSGRFTLDPHGGILENGEADAFFRNSGQSRFLHQPWTRSPIFLDDQEKPVPTPYDWGLSALFRDLNGDGAPDLYVCNDFQSPDRIWIHDGQGRFHPILGNAVRQTSLFSMGVDVADIDRDGHDDIFVADMLARDPRLRHVQVMDAAAFRQIRLTSSRRPQSSRNTLFLARGDGTYAEIAQAAGLDASDWSWCPAFLDVDLDGYEDLLVTTGHARDAQHADVARELDAETERRRLSSRDQLRLRRRFPRLDTPNVAFRNQTDRTFLEVGAAWGFDSRRISQGMAFADLDEDGDLDVVVNCLNDGPLVLRNDARGARISVRLRGTAPNTHGIGARVTVRAPGLPTQTQEMVLGGRYLSSDDPVRTFAAGHPTNRLSVEVRWRNGTRTARTELPAQHAFEFVQDASATPEAAARSRSESPPEPPTNTIDVSPVAIEPAFEDLSHLLGHEHQDTEVDESAIQPLLPRALGRAGPGVAWFDFNGDGWDDLLISGGRGSRLAVYRNNTQGGFVPQRARILEGTAEHPQLGVLGWRENPTQPTLLLSHDGVTAPPAGAPPLRRISLVTGNTDDTLIPGTGSAGPLALADVDADGDLDLFVGGRPLPGQFPEATPSRLLRNEAGRFVGSPEGGAVPGLSGTVQGAVFTDLDLDGLPELVLACDWGPIRIYRWDSGSLAPWDPPIRVAAHSAVRSASRPGRASEWTGWWNSVVAGDFDNDGRMDLVAGNWGRNSSRQSFLNQPLRLHFEPANQGSPSRLLESWVDPRSGQEMAVRDRNMLSMGFPGIPASFPTFASLAAAPWESVLAATGPLPEVRTAVTLDSVLLLRRDDGFELRPLPFEAQLAPIFGAAVADLDGDGNEDLFLAQNFFAVPPPESRLDAGTGVWLRGDGRGQFEAVPASKAGIRIVGEGRAAAAADFDHDGRTDLVVTQHRGLTSLFRNRRARPGWSVRLVGPAGNPQGIGTRLRLEAADGTLGPAREIHLGGGHLSQDATTPILGASSDPVAVQIRWPGGRTSRIAIPNGTKVIEARFPGP